MGSRDKKVSRALASKVFQPEDESRSGWVGLDGLFESWRSEALCAQVDPDYWFPEKGRNAGQATAICRECPVRQNCLEWALSRDEGFGVWGGFSERARRPMRQAVNRGADIADVAVSFIHGEAAVRAWSA